MQRKSGPTESIGRPAEWTQERYKRPQDPVENAVDNAEDQKQVPDEPSAPVTIADYVKKQPAGGSD
jgi:hypothetical protein